MFCTTISTSVSREKMSRENNALTQGTVRASGGDNASLVAGRERAVKNAKPIIIKRRRQWAGEVKPAQAGPEEMAQGSGLLAWRQTAIQTEKWNSEEIFFYSAFSLCWRIVSMLVWNMNTSSLHVLTPPTHPMRKISRAMGSLSCFSFFFFWEMQVNYLIHSEITTDSWVPFVHSTALDQNPGMIALWTMQILAKGQTGKYQDNRLCHHCPWVLTSWTLCRIPGVLRMIPSIPQTHFSIHYH